MVKVAGYKSDAGEKWPAFPQAAENLSTVGVTGEERIKGTMRVPRVSQSV